MADNILEIRHLSKSFGTHEVLRDIDFTVSKGDVISIIGASGSGKSTLLRCINLLETPSSGEILYHGENVTGKSVNAAKYRSHVGMVFQSFNLFNNMTVLKNCMVGQMKVLGRSKDEAHEQAMRYLEKVGMAPYVNAKPRQLSGGQKQRVAIARALAMNPEVLLFDEPTSALSSGEVEHLFRVVNELKARGMAIIFITHDLGVVSEICDKIIVMYAGKIVEEGKSRQIFYERCHPYTEGLLASVPRLESDVNEKLKPIKGNPPDMSAVKPGCAFAPRCSCAMKICVREEPPECELDETHKASCWQVIKKAMQNT